ncbi:1,4-alpha-glucan branching protein GlgB [Shouchella shacheensis]|uniref:1,4-alpha-glucan branching protein GlgB n=1 Tax=Shouchella shacheensis TaxID=1649580 RepID=UPI00346227E6
MSVRKDDVYLFHQGTNYYSYKLLGCHEEVQNGARGYRFAVWAPNAEAVSVVGDFNEWQGRDYRLTRLNRAGVWVGFFVNVTEGQAYKYELVTPEGDVRLKADPYATQAELKPATASIIKAKSRYNWNDRGWYEQKKKQNSDQSPISIYEVHAGTWRRREDGGYYSYLDLVETLIPYVKELGFTHIEFLPLSEHPFDGSWGYQITGYYAVTSRYGPNEDFKYFVDKCHQANIGVIMDWVPGHFCRDDHGLRQFDGRALYEYAGADKADKALWGTLAFDFGRPEVQSFLISNAMFWLEEYHMDGLRVDAVASMLYLNFDRSDQDPRLVNSFGGEENLEARALLMKLNEVVFKGHPDTLMIAEDSSNLPMVTSPTYEGGLGFNLKWNMGWMNDTLTYMETDPIYRKWHHEKLTFSMMYMHTENFMLPLSHDEVVHGKKSLLDKMPGDQWQQFAHLRLLYGYMMTHPGKKLLFMGGEFGQYIEWRDSAELDWLLLAYPLHFSMKTYMQALNALYRTYPALYEGDHKPGGFEWIDPHHANQSVIAFRRKAIHSNEELIVICNFTPATHFDYNIGVPVPGTYQEIFNSDAERFGGSGKRSVANHFSIPTSWHGLSQHIRVMIPPLSTMIYQQKVEP